MRVSRIGGVAVTKTCKKDGADATLKTKQGLRLHTRLYQGDSIVLQNGNLQCIGSYHNGPFNFNISKSGSVVGFKIKEDHTIFSNQMMLVLSSVAYKLEVKMQQCFSCCICSLCYVYMVLKIFVLDF